MPKKRVLIVGDLVVDRTLLVGKPARSERFAAHYDVLPRNLVEPSWRTDVAGGIVTAARVLGGDGIKLTIATAWGKDIDPRHLVPPAAPKASVDMQWIPLWRTNRTTVITRVFAYTPDEKQPTLFARYDCEPDEELKPALIPWPKPEDIDLIVAGDYVSQPQKTVLQSPVVLKQLSAYAKAGIPLLLRSIRKDVIEALPWTILSVNPHHLTRILDVSAIDGPAVKEFDGSCIYHPAMLETVNTLSKDFFKKIKMRFILLNLEGAGALLIDGESIHPVLLAGKRPAHQGVGATDVLLGDIARRIVQGSVDFSTGGCRKALLGICGEAVATTNEFSLRARKLDAIEGWYTPQIRFENKDGRRVAPAEIKDSHLLKEKVQQSRSSQDFEKLMKKGVSLHWASWYLKDYLTVNGKFGKDLVNLQKKIREYLQSPGKRPFVAAICGEPGSGKSALAKSLGETMRCENISENAAQWASPEDLAWLLERVRSHHVRDKACLVLIDEVDSLVDGEELYGKLLAPLWDGAYFIHGDERTLGSPTVFLLAGSTSLWKDESSLVEGSVKPTKVPSKLRDLVSRLSVPPVSIPSLKTRKADVVYLVTHHILKQSPRVERVEEGVFRLLAESPSIRHGVRSLTRVIELFANPRDEKVIRTSDLSEQSESVLKLHIPRPKAKWRNMTDEVKVGQ
jgi:sugar/nucleoside kinase (ribokinase family)